MRYLGVFIAVLTIVLAGCSAMTTITAKQPDATVAIVKSPSTAVPRTESFPTRSFGNYEFRAEAPGFDPFYGILPLKFNGGYLAADILFFTPAMFWNLREVYAFYEFDLEKKYVRYKSKTEEEWNTFLPLPADEQEGKEVMKPK
jgi:hypothetical protein